ncbi:hypothetical protein AB0J35_57905 [Nonomuraea angiospora]|uniref:hypothetical protein n=1 Tax=Nonomuraea angiospora TaxID=46172 RepID=UPI0034316328
MADPVVSITLTFRTPASSAVVLQELLTAFNRHAIPHELISANCDSFDLDEVDAEDPP